jgi:hypothetical protein
VSCEIDDLKTESENHEICLPPRIGSRIQTDPGPLTNSRSRTTCISRKRLVACRRISGRNLDAEGVCNLCILRDLEPSYGFPCLSYGSSGTSPFLPPACHMEADTDPDTDPSNCTRKVPAENPSLWAKRRQLVFGPGLSRRCRRILFEAIDVSIESPPKGTPIGPRTHTKEADEQAIHRTDLDLLSAVANSRTFLHHSRSHPGLGVRWLE